MYNLAQISLNWLYSTDQFSPTFMQLYIAELIVLNFILKLDCK